MEHSFDWTLFGWFLAVVGVVGGFLIWYYQVPDRSDHIRSWLASKGIKGEVWRSVFWTAVGLNGLNRALDERENLGILIFGALLVLHTFLLFRHWFGRFAKSD